MIDQRWIQALRQKDETAFEYIYDQTKRGVYSMVFSILKSHTVTEDIMQEVYMKMMKSIDQYQPKTNFYNWLIMIAKNQALDYYRRQKKEVYVDENDYNKTLISQEASPDQQTKFELMLDMLNETQRSIILLKIVDQMKFKDIAKVVEKPLGTVLWMYKEAMTILKNYEGLS